jgi:nucleotide-binding universal stress UspA family protein
MGTAQSATERMKIVVGIDFSEMSDRALRVAVNLARSAGSCEVHLVHVVPPPVGGTEFAPIVDIGEQTRLARQQLSKLIDPLTDVPEVLPFTHVLVGSPQKELPRVADEIEADLVVMGTHGRRGLDRALFGSVAEQVVRTAPCSVLTVRAKPLSAAASIEPACAECLAVAAKSEGKQLLCATHAEHHARAHTYSEVPPSFGMGSMTFRF